MKTMREKKHVIIEVVLDQIENFYPKDELQLQKSVDLVLAVYYCPYIKEEHLDDMIALIEFVQTRSIKGIESLIAIELLTTLRHDIQGLARNELMFCPRSDGYAKAMKELIE